MHQHTWEWDAETGANGIRQIACVSCNLRVGFFKPDPSELARLKEEVEVSYA